MTHEPESRAATPPSPHLSALRRTVKEIRQGEHRAVLALVLTTVALSVAEGMGLSVWGALSDLLSRALEKVGM